MSKARKHGRATYMVDVPKKDDFEREIRETMYEPSPEEILDPDMSAKMVDVYRHVYGNDPLWKEGAMKKTVWGVQKISLQKYLKLKAKGKADDYQEIFPRETVLAEWERILTSSYSQPVVIINKDKDDLKGFFIGEVGELETAARQQILYSIGFGDEEETQKIVSLLRKALKNEGILPSEKILWCEDILIDPQFRHKTGQFYDFICMMAYLGHKKGARFGVTWTKRTSLVSFLALLFGWKPILFYKDYIFYQHPNLYELYEVLKKSDYETIRGVISRL